MATLDIGRVCYKLTGRDAGNVALIIKVLDKNNVMIDGNTRRRKCNINHLTLSAQKADIKEDADHKAVAAALQELGFTIRERLPAKAAKPTKKEVIAAQVKTKTEATKKTQTKKTSILKEAVRKAIATPAKKEKAPVKKTETKEEKPATPKETENKE